MVTPSSRFPSLVTIGLLTGAMKAWCMRNHWLRERESVRMVSPVSMANMSGLAKRKMESGRLFRLFARHLIEMDQSLQTANGLAAIWVLLAMPITATTMAMEKCQDRWWRQRSRQQQQPRCNRCGCCGSVSRKADRIDEWPLHDSAVGGQFRGIMHKL